MMNAETSSSVAKACMPRVYVSNSSEAFVITFMLHE